MNEMKYIKWKIKYFFFFLYYKQISFDSKRKKITIFVKNSFPTENILFTKGGVENGLLYYEK